MIVFDVDGTLVGGDATDWQCFDEAFQQVNGFALDAEFYAGLTEVTAQAIVHHALAGLPREERQEKEQAVSDEYLRRLTSAWERDPSAFPATAGAVNLLQELSAAGNRVAIAKGDWRSSIRFKLKAAGVSFDNIPMVTSSEYHSRADIIRAAVDLAGGTLEEAVYVGDGLWDLRACERLGIPFIGVGQRLELLRQAGARHVLLNFDVPSFLRMIDAARSAG